METTTQEKTLRMYLKGRPYLFFLIPGFFVVASIAAIATWGLRPGIDLAGGSLLQVEYEERPELSEVNVAVGHLNYGEIRVQESGERGFVLRQRDLMPDEKDALMEALGTLGQAEELQFNSIGPSIGSELMRKSWWAIGMVSIATILFIAFAFRHVSKPVSSWKYGIVAIITLFHDVLIPTGLFAYLGHTRGAEVGVFFIIALLSILGISINDTIVVFDRIRENLRLNEEKHQSRTFGDIVWNAVGQTLARSINTTLTVLIMLGALFVLGPESTKDFSLTLIVGLIAGTYSSILLASPLLVELEKHQPKVKEA